MTEFPRTRRPTTQEMHVPFLPSYCRRRNRRHGNIRRRRRTGFQPRPFPALQNMKRPRKGKDQDCRHNRQPEEEKKDRSPWQARNTARPRLPARYISHAVRLPTLFQNGDELSLLLDVGRSSSIGYTSTCSEISSIPKSRARSATAAASPPPALSPATAILSASKSNLSFMATMYSNARNASSKAAGNGYWRESLYSGEITRAEKEDDSRRIMFRAKNVLPKAYPPSVEEKKCRVFFPILSGAEDPDGHLCPIGTRYGRFLRTPDRKVCRYLSRSLVESGRPRREVRQKNACQTTDEPRTFGIR